MKRNLRKTFFFILLLFLVCPTSFAQIPLQVSGIVSNANGPLSSVSVIVKGTQNGAITDANGKYSLSNVPGSGVLIFSSIGFENQEIFVNNRAQINVQLKANIDSLDQVVVVGYGTQSKRKITGSIAQVDMSKTKNLPNTNVSQALSGVAGVQFTANGRPGQDGSILIRGQNSLSADNNPLIVVDGIIFNGSLTDINPQDIQSMDVLKDASAASIYGSRAANGVILITSKKGTTEKPAIRLNVFSGISDFASEVKLLSPERYIQRRLDWRKESGLEVDPNKIPSYFSATEAENYKKGISHNVWDLISQQGKINSVDLSLSAKSKFTNYYLSASLTDDHGLIYNDNQKRTTIRSNLNSKVADWLNMGFDATYAHRDLSGVNASIRDAYRSSPYGTFYYTNGDPTQYPVPDEQAASNPMRDAMLTKNNETYDNLFSNFFAEISFPIKGLSYRLNYSPNVRWHHNYNYMRQDPHVNVNNTSASKFNQQNFDWVLENILHYKTTLGQDHNFDFTLLYSRDHSEFESTTANADLLSIDALGYNNLGLGSILTNSSLAQSSEGISYMGRMNYQFKSKYLLTLTIRRDGSSVFSVNNKYATFPSGAVAWIVSDEPFLEKSQVINSLKLRLSYGSVGNQAIAPYQSLSLSETQRYVFGNGGSSSLGVVTSTLGNDNLKWETSYIGNLAIDFSLFERRISGTIETYNSNTKNLLVRRTIPVMNGFNSILTNVGETNNRGLEITLNTVNIQTNRFQWKSTLSFSHNKNKIIHLFETDLNHDGKEDNSVANGWFIGQPINSYYDYVFNGIYQEGDTDIPPGSQPGFVRVKDLNGDKVIDSKDRTVVGSGVNPKYQIGLSNTFSYGHLSLSIYVNSMEGWIAPFNLINPLVPGRSINQLDAGWWTPENKSNMRPSLTYSNPLGTSWYVSRDFIRIRDLSLAYEFDKNILNKIRLTDLRLFASVKNLYTFTKWLGSDPESGGEYSDQQGNDQLFPMPRTFALGLNASF
jgi:TonB-linked SusC/RagA family outer membrane protein